LGLGVVLLFGMLGWSFELTLAGILQKSLRADYIVTSAYVTGGYWSAPISDRVVDEIRSIPGVAVSAGEQSKEVTLDGTTIYVKSYDPVAFSDRRVYDWPIGEGSDDALARVQEGRAVLVTRAFAHAHGTRPQTTLRVDTPRGAVDMRVAGVTDAPVESAIVMSRSLYRSVWNDEMVSLVHVVLGPGTSGNSVRQAILAGPGMQYRLLVRPRDEIIAYFVDQVRRAFSVLYLMEAATFLLVLMGIGDALVASVVERTREIGMMRALGLTRNRLFGIIILEGVTVGLLGLLLALTAGLALGTFWVAVQFPAILGWKIDIHFPTQFAVGAAGITLALCLVGSFLPSLRAVRMSVPDAIRDE
jgi:putative ABC transport system permease protein